MAMDRSAGSPLSAAGAAVAAALDFFFFFFFLDTFCSSCASVIRFELD
jgi:hypothetical protein